MARSGTEAWNIGGKKYKIAATYYLALPQGLQFTIEYELPGAAATTLAGISDADAYDIAFPLMRYACEHRAYERAQIAELTNGSQKVSRIGVALFRRSSLGVGGYRVARSIADIQARIASAK